MQLVAHDLTTADGVTLVAGRWACDDARAAVVLVHGFAASSGDASVVAVAEHLRTCGFEVLSYDARGHGRSGGAATLGDRERFDVAAAVDAASLSGAPVVLVAASVGAVAALRYAAGTPGAVSGVVMVSCPARWRLPRNARGVLSAVLTQTALGRRVARRSMGVRIASHVARPAPPVELVARVGAPLAIVHGRADPFIPWADAELLYAEASEPRRLALVAGMGHAYEPRSVDPITAAVDWVLAR
jgi:uncharacterized protein